jgi:type I restriction enzyme S subunit
MACSEEVEPGYFERLLKSTAFISALQTKVTGIRDGKSVKYHHFADILLPCPDTAHQKAIANFLDTETSRIDQLIEKKQQQVALLRERWFSTIDTLIFEQQGEDWQSLRLRHLARAISKGTTPSTLGRELTESGVRFLKAENITPNGVSTSPEYFVSYKTDELLKRSRLAAGDNLVVIAGATTGKSAVLFEEMLPANTNQAVSFVRLKDRSLAGWVQTVLASKRIQFEIRLTSVQSAQPNLAMEDLGRLSIPMPPSEQRHEIEEHVQLERQCVSRLTGTVSLSIDRLTEYRSALITAAVTGQVDVTRWGRTGEGDKRLDQIQEEMAG